MRKKMFKRKLTVREGKRKKKKEAGKETKHTEERIQRHAKKQKKVAQTNIQQ